MEETTTPTFGCSKTRYPPAISALPGADTELKQKRCELTNYNIRKSEVTMHSEVEISYHETLTNREVASQ